MIIFKGITHVAVSVTLYFYLFGFNPAVMSAIIFGSLLPDIDTKHSTLGRYNIFASLMNHRGITHTTLALAISTLIMYAIFDSLAWGFMYGYMMHLIMDSLTPMGIMWLHPYSKSYYGLFGKN